MLAYVVAGFCVLFLFIFLLQVVRARKDRARSEAAHKAAAVERFKEVFGISAYTGRAEAIARVKTVIMALSLKRTQDLSNYEEHNKNRLEAIRLAQHFGFSVLTGREAQEQARRAHRSRLATTSRQTGGAAETAA
ncbi:MAG: hypothetical protein EXS68_00630 [Candidatus Ryanbacteria bacterium]|nr:hypothetical protein [Candidatus Ryanbacteria bacterium]